MAEAHNGWMEKSEIDDAMVLVTDYDGHTVDCVARYHPEDCTCGYREALENAKEILEKLILNA